MGAFRQPLMDSIQRDRGGTTRATPWAAPLLGLNTRDNLASMLPGYARQLDNLYPTAGECIARGGSQVYQSTLNVGVDTTGATGFFAYGSTKLFFGGNAGIYDVTPGITVPTVAFASGNVGRGMSVNFTNSAGSVFLWLAGSTGATYPITYDGTTWVERTGTAITGVDARNLRAPWVFKRKIFAVEAGTMNAWFLPTDSIIGAASKLPLGGLFKKGGTLVAGATWTNDGGDGPDDYCVFISSEGEVAVYGGIDPSSSSSWSLVGVYDCGRPPSRRCFTKYGGDLILLTQMGALPLSKVTASDTDRPDIALTDNIRPTIQSALKNIALATNDDRYSIHMFPAQNALLINIPISTTLSYQYVMNVITGAWCRFTGLNVQGLEVFNGKLYFGGATTTAAYIGELWATQDANSDIDVNAVAQSIIYTAKTAYQNFRSPNLKTLPLLRPQLAYSGNITLGMGVAVDYVDVDTPTGYATISTSSFSFWDTAIWDVSLWSATFQRINNWLSVPHAPGYALSLLLQLVSNQAIITWSGTDVLVAGAGVRG